jgi:hypothetical protein
MAKYADEIAKRFSSGKDADGDTPAAEPDDDADDSSAAAALGRRLMRAIKAGDGLAICEAVKAIASE